MTMTITFWGVRGSIPSPGPETANVGGNTSCVEVRCGNTSIILDAGSGIRKLGDQMMSRGYAVETTLLLSHVHWDHIQGLPFFTPAYVPSTKLTIAGAPGGGHSLQETLAQQMTAPVFPVRLDELGSQLTIKEIKAGQAFHVGEARILAVKGNHPGGVMVYRIEHAGRAVVYATDVEHYECVDPVLLNIARAADVLIYDSMYTPEEYRGERGRCRVGWGHSTFAAATDLAQAAGVKQLVLFHHDPTRSDREVFELEKRAQERFADTVAAREGLCLEHQPAAWAALLNTEGQMLVSSTFEPARWGSQNASMSNRLSLLVDLASLLTREVDFDALLQTACERLAAALRADRASIWLVDAEHGDLVTRVATLPEVPALRQPIERGIAGYVARTGETVRIDDVSLDDRFDPSNDRTTGYTTRSMLVVPLREDVRNPVRGVVQLLNREGGTFDEEDARYLEALATQMARALALTTLRAADAKVPGVTLRGPFNRIIGRSDKLRAVYERVALAAQTDATVLLRGETGTGKGLFARAIHVNSKRQAKPFITVDCTTLPPQLVESELFGHERGAFTGADRKVPGKVELAEGGTLFLDEIGDLPHDIQGKLLRFLQDRSFERVGGRATLTADIRIVCATHRNLEKAVRENTFREDLYYRIRVVEIDLPPLRQRGVDEIDSLAIHFAEAFAQRYQRPTPHFSDEAMALIRAHHWPGNVRELEHWIESAIVLAADGNIRPEHLPQPRHGLSTPPPSNNKAVTNENVVELPLSLSLEDATRRYIDAVVQSCGGNRSEAAKSLKVGRNTITRTLKK